jgi:hypothetical protein
MIGINTFMKKFYPTYLYVKTHNVTGLKYFGKTTKSNPHSYKGSGEYWIDHLKIHGKNISTEIIGFFEDKDECVITALKFSEDHNIVHALAEDGKKVWANQIIENGLDGGDTGRKNYKPHSDETKQKISKSRKGQSAWNTGRIGANPGNTNPRTDEQKEKISKKLTGRKRTPESIEKTAEKLRGRKRPDVSAALTGKKKSSETITKMKLAQQNKGPLDEETKMKIKEARSTQENVFPLGDFLKGKVIVVDKHGNKTTITKDSYYNQTGPKENWEWVSHKSKEARMRRG